MPVAISGSSSVMPRHWIANSARLGAEAFARSVEVLSGVPPKPPPDPFPSLLLGTAAPPAPPPPEHHPWASRARAAESTNETAAIHPSSWWRIIESPREPEGV
jgi:hypothetical protein